MGVDIREEQAEQIERLGYKWRIAVGDAYIAISCLRELEAKGDQVVNAGDVNTTKYDQGQADAYREVLQIIETRFNRFIGEPWTKFPPHDHHDHDHVHESLRDAEAQFNEEMKGRVDEEPEYKPDSSLIVGDEVRP